MNKLLATLLISCLLVICCHGKTLNEMELPEIRSLIQEQLDKSKIKGIALEGSRTKARVATYTEDGSLLAVGFGERIAHSPNSPNFRDSTVKVYSSSDFSLVAELTTANHGVPYSLNFIGNTQLLVGYEEGAVLWDIETKTPLHTYLPKLHTGFDNPPPKRIDDSIVTPDRERLLLVGGGQIHVFSLETNRELNVFRTPWHVSGAFLPNGDFVSAHNRDLRVWDSQTWEVKESFPLNGQVKGIGLSNDKGRLYIATANPEEHPTLDIYTWNLTENSLKGRLFTIGKHRDNITAIQFMPSIGSILTSSYDRTTKRWSAESGELQHTYNFENILTATGKVAIVEGFNPIALEIE